MFFLLHKSKVYLQCNDKCYEHVLDSVLENEGCKIFWDFPIQTDKVIEYKQHDISSINKIAKSCLIIHIATPGYQNIIAKELEKIDKYQDLLVKFEKLWKLRLK